MKLIKYAFIIFCLAGTISVQSQKINITYATKQGWAGGVCCRYGVNFNINFQVIRSRQTITLDTLWLEGYCRDLSQYNTMKKRSRDTLTISIVDGIVNDERWYELDQKPDLGCFDPTKTGVQIVYRVGKKKMVMNLDPYMKELEFLAFP